MTTCIHFKCDRLIFLFLPLIWVMGEGTKAVAQWVEFTTSGQEVVGSIPAPGARSLLVGSVSV